MRKLLQNVAVLSLTVFITVGVLELGLRIFMPVDYRNPQDHRSDLVEDIIYQASTAPGLDYELKPNVERQAYGVMVKTNHYGMRGPEPALTSEKRIVVIGDSYTFGYGVAQENIFPTVLQDMLREQGYSYTVLNLAVPGYATSEEVAALRDKGLGWDPDVVIVGYVLNDPEVDPIQDMSAYFRKPNWWQHFHVLRFAAKARKSLEVLVKGEGSYLKYLHADRRSWGSVVQGFGEIRRMADEQEAQVIVLIFPDLWQEWADYPYGDLHQQVAGLAREYGFGVIDLRDAFSPYPPDDLRISGGDGHPNRLAHALVAEAVLDYLVVHEE